MWAAGRCALKLKTRLDDKATATSITGGVLQTVLAHEIYTNMAKIIECVPNFSEGANKDIIDGIAKAISDTDGKYFLVVNVCRPKAVPLYFPWSHIQNQMHIRSYPVNDLSITYHGIVSHHPNQVYSQADAKYYLFGNL